MDGDLPPWRRDHRRGDGPPHPRTGIGERGSFQGEVFPPLLLGTCQRHVGIRPEILARSRLPHQRLSFVRSVSSVGRETRPLQRRSPREVTGTVPCGLPTKQTRFVAGDTGDTAFHPVRSDPPMWADGGTNLQPHDSFLEINDWHSVHWLFHKLNLGRSLNS